MCKGNLILDKEKSELICKFDAVAYKIDDGIPVMLPESGRPLTTDEKLAK
ncbi:MAG: hypothetical protein ACJA1U_002575 [Bermanella sp.]|jgi:uncharacterized protein YbaR (Trm112 family)